MDYLVIEVPDENDSMVDIVLDDVFYILRFTYNDTKDYWTFGVYDDAENPIAIGMKIVPGTPCNIFFGATQLPGVFGVITNLDRVGRDDFVNGKAEFVFISETAEDEDDDEDEDEEDEDE